MIRLEVDTFDFLIEKQLFLHGVEKFDFLHSMEKQSTRVNRVKSTILFTLEMDTFKVMLLLFYLASLDNKPRT